MDGAVQLRLGPCAGPGSLETATMEERYSPTFALYTSGLSAAKAKEGNNKDLAWRPFLSHGILRFRSWRIYSILLGAFVCL